MGKVVARIIQGRVQKLAERDPPESQCGFRKGCGCTDMVFTIRQLTDKAIELKLSSSSSLSIGRKLMTQYHKKPCGWH